jgi:hypothetical protein
MLQEELRRTSGLLLQTGHWAPQQEDLKGAIGVEILSQSAGPGRPPFLGPPHFGSPKQATRLSLKPAQLTVVPVAPGLFAVVTYPVSIRGGTGRFKGASGKLNVIGKADFNAGHIGLRYDGEVCFEKEEARRASSSAKPSLFRTSGYRSNSPDANSSQAFQSEGLAPS